MRTGGGRRHLLAEHDRAPRARFRRRCAECDGPGPCGRGRRERDRHQEIGERLGVGIEVEQSTTASNRRREVAHVVERQLAADMISGRRERDHAMPVRRASACGGTHRRDTPHNREWRSRRDDRTALSAVKGVRTGNRSASSPGADAAGLPSRPRAQLAGRVRKDLADGVVELAHTREPRRERDVGQIERCRLDQDPGGLRSLRPCQRERARRRVRPAAAAATVGCCSPARAASPVTPSRSTVPSAISRMARATTSPRSFHSGEPGEASGRQRLQARNPACCAAAAVGKNRTFLANGVRAGQLGRQ